MLLFSSHQRSGRCGPLASWPEHSVPGRVFQKCQGLRPQPGIEEVALASGSQGQGARIPGEGARRSRGSALLYPSWVAWILGLELWGVRQVYTGAPEIQPSLGQLLKPPPLRSLFLPICLLREDLLFLFFFFPLKIHLLSCFSVSSPVFSSPATTSNTCQGLCCPRASAPAILLLSVLSPGFCGVLILIASQLSSSQRIFCAHLTLLLTLHHPFAFLRKIQCHLIALLFLVHCPPVPAECQPTRVVSRPVLFTS